MEGPGLTVTAAGAQPQAEPAAHAPVPSLVTNASLGGHSLEVSITSLRQLVVWPGWVPWVQDRGVSAPTRTRCGSPGTWLGGESPCGNKAGWKGVTLRHLCPAGCHIWLCNERHKQV